MADAFIIAGARTPTGAFQGALKSIPAPELGAVAIRTALTRGQIAPGDVDEVIMGNVISAGLGQAPARQAALKAGLPSTISCVTINKVCGSGLQAIMFAAQAIRAGDARIVVAGGMENMSRAPHVAFGLREGQKLGDLTMKDAMILDGLTCAFNDCHMGNHAEHIARKFQVTREDQDGYAAESQRRAAKAQSEGIFDAEIAPVLVKTRKEEMTVRQDEGIRSETTAASLAALRPVFDKAGSVTAGNASTLSDGAAAVVVAAGDVAKDKASTWNARIVAYHTSGTDPQDLFIAPVEAVRGAVRKAGWNLSDVDLFEINEAFAAQMVACIKELKIDSAKVNIFGGGISLGHPIGASGARTVVTLLNALARKNAKRGVVSLCLGGGNAVAMAVER